MSYITGIGAYLPRLRLTRTAMESALGWLTGSAGIGKGSRTLAYWDEDSITMAVAAARNALAACPNSDVQALHFCTTTPPFAEPQNATFLRAALRLPENAFTHDHFSTSRSSMIALHQALERETPSLITAGDMPMAVPGSVAEARSGDGAAAVLTGGSSGLLRYLGGANLSAAFTDRYRAAGETFPQAWEDRWVREAGYMELLCKAISQALNAAGLRPEAVATLILPCPIPGVAAAVARKAGLTNAKLAPALSEVCGDTGSAHAFLMLAHALEDASPDQTVLLAQFGQGATALLFATCQAVADRQPYVSGQLQGGVTENNYLKLLAYRGHVPWDRGLRGRFIVNEALSTAWRNTDALLGFVGGRCRKTGQIQFPPTRLSAGDGFHLDTQEPFPLADLSGYVTTFTVDLLAFSPSPPNCYGFVDIEGGARLLMEFTDPRAKELSPGDKVEFVFRIKDLDEITGYRRYFWKSVPASADT